MIVERIDFRALAVGDRVPASVPDHAICAPGPSRWYALRVSPQREDWVEKWLGLRGVYGFHPVLIRKSVRFGRAREYQRRYLPGYVFARFRGEPLIHRVMACPHITGALCRQDGSWGVLEPERLQAIHAMRAIDADAVAARKAEAIRKRQQMAVRKGDRAMFRGGVFAGMQCEVVELQPDGGAVIRLGLYGREVLLASPHDELVPLRLRA